MCTLFTFYLTLTTEDNILKNDGCKYKVEGEKISYYSATICESDPCEIYFTLRRPSILIRFLNVLKRTVCSWKFAVFAVLFFVIAGLVFWSVFTSTTSLDEKGFMTTVRTTTRLDSTSMVTTQWSPLLHLVHRLMTLHQRWLILLSHRIQPKKILQLCDF